MGGRWLEVYKASRTELFRATGSVAALRPDASFEGVVVASGLPFRLSPSNLVDFFKGYEVVRNGVYVLACSTLVHVCAPPKRMLTVARCDGRYRFIINHPSGRPSGDAYIVFRNPDDAKAAVRALVRGPWAFREMARMLAASCSHHRSPLQDGKSLDGRSVNLRVVTKGALCVAAVPALRRSMWDDTLVAVVALQVQGTGAAPAGHDAAWPSPRRHRRPRASAGSDRAAVLSAC